MAALSPVFDRHSLADIAYTLSVKRSCLIQRAFSIVDTTQTAPLTFSLDTKLYSSPQPVRLGFVFTGQGAQWHAMGAELLQYNVFQNTISYLDRILEMFPEPVSWKIVDVLSGACEKELIRVPAVSQTVCTALQIGLIDLLALLSIRPVGVVGHSSGKMAAAYAAGHVTAAEAITAAFYRGYIVSFNKLNGAMLVAGIGPEKGFESTSKARLEEKVRVAAINSPDSITMSRDADAIEALSDKVLKTGGLAYHSHHMLPLGHNYTDYVDDGKKVLLSNGIDKENVKYSAVLWMSLSGQGVPTAYWRSNLESPVRFTEALSKLIGQEDLGIGAVIDIGPHPALKSPVAALVELAGTLFALNAVNAEVDLVVVNAADGSSDGTLVHGTTAVDLPPYQYTYGPINYYECCASKEYRLRTVQHYDLLGSKIPGTTRLRAQWRNMLKLKDLPWLDDHRVPPHVLRPGAAHIVMAMLTVQQAYSEFPGALPVTGIALRNVSIKKTLVVPEDDHGIEIVLRMGFEDSASAKTPGWATFSISSAIRDSEQWTEHCSGLAKVELGEFGDVEPVDTTMDGRAVDAETWYKRFAEVGLRFGPSFQGYSDIYADPVKNVVSAKLALNTTAGMFPGGESEYPIHPASLDLVIPLGPATAARLKREVATVSKDEPFSKLTNIFDLLGHANPDLKILQLKASSDLSISQAIVKTLVGHNGIKRYRDFPLTDTSSDLLAPLKSDFRDVKYSVLNIDKPRKSKVSSKPMTQKSQQALENSKKLLKPGGKLTLLETLDRNWDEALVQAGFNTGAELVTEKKQSALIMYTICETEKPSKERSSTVHILHGSQGAPALLSNLSQVFEQRGLSTKILSFDSALEIPSNTHVIAFLDNENLLLGADQQRISFFQHLSTTACSMVWLTFCGLVQGRNPDGAFVQGLLRTLGYENPAAQFLSIDIDASDFQVAPTEIDELVCSIAEQESLLQPNSGVDSVNREFAWQDNALWVSRLVPDTALGGYSKAVTAPEDSELEPVPLGSQGPVHAAFGTPGILTSLFFKPYLELMQPLTSDWIEVKVDATGLNWKDLGLCAGRFDQNNLSNEYVGVATKLGSAVKVGDRVYGMGKGHFGNYTRVPAVLAQQVPLGVDSLDAAPMPLVYMTAVYAFEHITRLGKGKKVLIQSASGGLGLAAIHLARAHDAEIFATAGTKEKVQFLSEEMGIPASHTFSSRDPADIKRMVNATQNGGFDAIISSSHGEMLYKSIKALAPLGRLIDVGRLDVTSSNNITLKLFQKSASFTSFDLGLVIERDVQLGGDLMKAVNEHFIKGRICPVKPYLATDVSQLGQTLLKFSKGTHIGKMVISYRDPDSLIKMHKALTPANLTYYFNTTHGYDAIKEILDKLEDVNTLYPHDSLRSYFGEDALRTRPLYEAAGRFSRIQHVPLSLFLDHGADVNLRNEDGQAPLHNAVAVSNKIWIVDLLDAGADINAQITPTVVSKATDGSRDMTPGFTPLHVAASRGSEWMTRLLLERGSKFDLRDSRGHTALDVAVARRHQGPFWALVEYGAPRGRKVVCEVPPLWVFTSKQIVRKPEILVSSLEHLILRNSLLGKQTIDLDYCVKCSAEKVKEVEAFTQKLDNIKKWRGPWTFNTAFTKRCLLCRQITQTLEPFSRLIDGDAESVDSDEGSGRMSPGARIKYEQSQNRYPTLEPGVTLYEDCEGYKGVAWECTITEELGTLLKHIERWPDADTGSRAAFVMAGYWLHTCLTSHQKCRLSDAIPHLPTRVIDVGDGVDKLVRLIASEDTHGLYCTLSYRWYDSLAFKTTTENISQLYQGIPEDALHHTIREAIITTRTLGLRYLWVDALCIIQDDTDDWTREAARMSAVYENSMLTIAAIDSPSAEQGMFRTRKYPPRPYNRDFPLDSPTGYFGHSHPFFVFSNNCRARPLGELDTRGWCLQEQFLSPRILSYADGELFWECCEVTASESYPGGVSQSNRTNTERLQTRKDWQAFNTIARNVRKQDRKWSITGPSKKDAVTLWCTIVEEFTRRRLTVEMDRLVAIQGISSIITAYTNEEMVLGMCTSPLPRHLLWWVNTIAGTSKVPDALYRPAHFRCPSWSWASVVGPIAYNNINGKALGMYRNSSYYDERDLDSTGTSFTPHVEVVETCVARVLNGWEGTLTLRGVLMKAYVREKGEKITYYCDVKSIQYTGHRIFVGPGPPPPRNNPAPSANKSAEEEASENDIFANLPARFADWGEQGGPDAPDGDFWEQWFPDTTDDFPSEMLCLLIGVEFNSQYCLCLVPVGDGMYRRIGVCSWYLGRVDVGAEGRGVVSTVRIV
ncbi:hypothetical protein GQ44DRAFT_808784 [Phaeosphaeriaceae sp. PMI808]|nr:hypothetical protein GQ44DRAFT_808784 [Phaeosphaeriaceae sp. PMI808]